MFQVDVCGFQLASKTPFRSAFEAVQLLTKVHPSRNQNKAFSLFECFVTVKNVDYSENSSFFFGPQFMTIFTASSFTKRYLFTVIHFTPHLVIYLLTIAMNIIWNITISSKCITFTCLPQPGFWLQELELYKEELLSKPAILVVNKMDLPEAEEKLRELETQLENQEGRKVVTDSTHVIQPRPHGNKIFFLLLWLETKSLPQTHQGWVTIRHRCYHC